MTHALLEVKHLDKHFGGLHVLKDINITVQEGEIVGILGPNGAGKTTLFNLLTGFIPADEGQVLLRGKSLREMRSNDIVGLGVARTFQLCRPFVGLTICSIKWAWLAKPIRRQRCCPMVIYAA
jgi:branched-chain amino acid transport system ATP-binding protein